ncbi:unnamed protein product [Effrenium voratum]|nr:unnamed protein product [Effrenium voratum]
MFEDSVGGGESVVTTYNYNKKWCSFSRDNRRLLAYQQVPCYTIDSGNFKQPSHRNTLAVENLKVGTEDLNNPVVKYGDFSMPTDLVTQLCHWESANDLVKGPVKFGSCEFERSGAWFYYPKQRQPEVGDVRVAFEHVPNGEVTIMALQCEDKARIASFVPYRLVSRGFCGISTGKLQESLLAQGRKDPSQIYEEESCTSGPLKYLCCCCNLINLAFSQIPPQIFAAWHGHLDQRECFQSLETSGMLMKWGVRGLSWLLLYASCYMLFQPLLVVLDIIPFLGPYLSSGTSFVLCLVIFIITLLLLEQGCQ